MATSSAQGSFEAGASTSLLLVVRITPTTRNQRIWSKLDLCEMSDGSQRARCKACGSFLNAQYNTTLKNHLEKHCKLLKSTPAQDQYQLSHNGAGV